MKAKISSLEVQSIIDKLEANTTFATRNDLWQSVADEYNKIKCSDYTVATIRSQTYKNVTLKTKSAKPFLSNSENKVPRKTIDKTSIVALENYVKHRDPTNRYARTVKAVKSGSLKNAIKLMCLDCTNFDTKEIKECEIKSCALWNFRPFKV